MTENVSQDSSGRRRGGLAKGVALGVLFTALGAGAGYGAVVVGLLPVGFSGQTSVTPRPAFVAIDQVTVPLGDGSSNFLRMVAHVEVEPGSEESVQALMPRITDVLHTYLRSVSISDLEDPRNLLQLRAQMLRRVDLVVGHGSVRDLLIQEYLVN